MDFWGALWLGVGGVVIGLVALVRTHRRRSAARDLGSVSSQWIAEQRANQEDGSAR